MSQKPYFKGHLIAIGGNEDKVKNLVVLKRVVHEVGKVDFKVGVITTASEYPEERGEAYHKVFTKLGASEIEVLHINKRIQANDKILAKTFDDMDLIFLAGGNQLRLTTILGGSRILDAIKNRLKDGALIVGTSAGATAFSDTMIYEGGENKNGLLKGRVLTTSGFSFVKNIVFDTHFMSRGRIGRLIQIVTTNPTCLGVGICEDSGIIFKNDGTAEVIGTGEVIIVDGSDIAHSNIMNIKHGEPIAVENVRIHSLVNGYGYNFRERQFLDSLPPNELENKDD
jgi:cyanophycinase